MGTLRLILASKEYGELHSYVEQCEKNSEKIVSSKVYNAQVIVTLVCIIEGICVAQQGRSFTCVRNSKFNTAEELVKG